MIEEGLGGSWPEEVQPAAQPFKQGHLIEKPPFAYAGDLRHPVWGATKTLAEETPSDERGVEVVELDPAQGPTYGIILTQTCDLTEEDRDPPLQPWIEVHPVYSVAKESPLLRRGTIYQLDPPTLGDQPWVADLRIKLPLEKSILVGCEPIEAFPDEAGYIEFANAMARRIGRPALASVFNEMFTVVADEINKAGPMKSLSRLMRKEVYSCRLAIEDGDRLRPAVARLHVVTTGEVTESMSKWFGAWWDRARQVAEEFGLELLPVNFMTPDTFDLPLYDSLVEIRMKF